MDLIENESNILNLLNANVKGDNYTLTNNDKNGNSGNSTVNDEKNPFINGPELTILYSVLYIIMALYYIIPLVYLYKNRKWYIIKQRNFLLTFLGSIANFISNSANVVTFIIKLTCAIQVYTSSVIMLMMQVCCLSRGFRLILLYKLNIYKVTQLSQKKFLQTSAKSRKAITEPNIYYKTIYKLVEKRIVYWLILIPLVIEFIAAIILQTSAGQMCRNFFSNFTDINDKILNPSPDEIDKINRIFLLPQINGILFVVMNSIIAIIFVFSDIKDDQKAGIKFDCFSTAILGAITEVIHIIFQKFGKEGPLKEISTVTKEGILFFCIIGLYIQFTSVIIPLYKCRQSKKLEKKYKNEPTNTMQYFYKILNSPSLVEELKAIAIQEFVVENVLFWENYCTLQALVYRFKHKKGEFGEGSSGSHGRYIYQEAYSQNSGNSNDEESYDPNYPLMEQLVPYFNAFYHTFIDIEGPASVNISGATVRRIYHDFYTYPTVGIFDEAKDEVVESMYLSLFPILLQQNRKQLGELYSR